MESRRSCGGHSALRIEHLALLPPHAIRSCQQNTEPDVDQIDISEAQHDLSVEHDTFVEQAIHQVEQALIGCFE